MTEHAAGISNIINFDIRTHSLPDTCIVGSQFDDYMCAD